MAVQANVTLSGTTSSTVGRERIRLLEAVAREGSISAAARSVGLTYKAAWDGLDAMANLLGRPLLAARAGGRAGGGAQLTEAGRQVIASFHRLEAELQRVLRELEPELSEAGLGPVEVLTGFLSRTSCRNVLRGRVTTVRSGRVSADIGVDIGNGTLLRSRITRDSAESLGVCPGRDVTLLVKASSVALEGQASGAAPPDLNRLTGTVARITTDGDSAEVVLDVAEGRTIAASLAARAVQRLGLAPGGAASALIDPASVIIAVD